MDNTIPQDAPQKQCFQCKEFFPATTQFFTRDKNKKDGLCSWCKTCKGKKSKIDREKHPDYRKQYYRDHKEELAEKQKIYQEKNQERISQKRKTYHIANKEKLNQQSREYHKTHHDQVKASNKKWRDEHKDYMKQKREEYYATHKDDLKQKRRVSETRVKAIAKKYGLTLEQWKEIYEKQNGCCAICLKPFKGTNDIHTDHCHRTGVVRGLLCRGCNHGIGNLGDDINVLMNARDYLLKQITSEQSEEDCSS